MVDDWCVCGEMREVVLETMLIIGDVRVSAGRLVRCRLLYQRFYQPWLEVNSSVKGSAIRASKSEGFRFLHRMLCHRNNEVNACRRTLPVKAMLTWGYSWRGFECLKR